ncbi:MAG: M23 family metallopeptidase [Sphingomonadaceae bacterium]|nr:M23 family metallopeptidase [Sphingomonadaceae bacterium]
MRRTLALVGGVAALLSLLFLVWVYGFGRVVDRGMREEAAPRDAGQVVAGELMIPVLGVTPAALSDTFTQARAGGDRRHDAIDIAAPAGTLVVAAAPGTVEKLFRSDDGGNTVYVRSRDGRFIHYYAHLHGYARGLREGANVETGDPLGAVGASGNADPAAPHLHFSVHRLAPGESWWQGRAVNPYPLLTDPD